jgi:hypothetical protein
MAAGFLMVVTVGTSLPGPKPPFWETAGSLPVTPPLGVVWIYQQSF